MRIQSIFGITIALALGACADVTSSCRVDASEQQPCLAGAIQYSNLPGQPDGARIITVNVDNAFNIYERAKILRAVNEWNVVLNGQVRLEIQPATIDPSHDLASGTRRPDGWTIAKIDSRNPLISGSGMNRALAVTIGSRKAAIYVVADRVGGRDLGGIMMHEFGHAFGASHDSGSALMHPYYAGDKQRCIDKGAVRAVAVAQKLDFDRLNWCLAPGERVNVAAAPTAGRAGRTALRSH